MQNAKLKMQNENSRGTGLMLRGGSDMVIGQSHHKPMQSFSQQQPQHRMKTITLLLNCLLACTLSAAEPSQPAPFEVRLVLDSASPDSEQLIQLHQGPAPGQTFSEPLNVQKKPLLDRSALKSAAVQKDRVTGTPAVEITFTEQGAKRFAEVTRDHVGRRLAFVVDGKVCTSPKVEDEISRGKIMISGPFSEQGAAQLAARLNEGAAK